jgi:hypothetical protein
MRKTLLFSACACASFSAIAQDSSFQLKNYKYRTEGFQALALEFGMGGHASGQQQAAGTKTKGNSFTIQPTAVSYNRFRSTDKKLQQAGITAGASFSTSNVEYDKKESKYRSGSAVIGWNISERYFSKGQWFLELGHAANVNTGGSKVRDTLRDNRSRNPNLGANVSVGIGKGRIEAVQDAQMAMYILNDLQQQGLLQQPADAATTLELARLITDINNRRVFDSRRRRIYELTRIDEFLRNKGLVEKTDIRVFTTINDNWALAFNPQRLSGTSWYVRLQPSISWNKNYRNFKEATVNTEYNATGTSISWTPDIGIVRYTPVNLHWQRNMGATLTWNQYRIASKVKQVAQSGTTETKETTKPSTLNGNLFYNIGYFPNNRTLVQAGTNILVQHSILDQKLNTITSQTEIRPTLNLSADYFISYNTRLSLQGYAYHNSFQNKYANGNTIKTNSWSSGFSVAINHVIF